MKNKGLQKQKKDASPFYKVIEDIRFKKVGNLLDEDENLKAFNNYMALRFLSMDRDNIDIVNMLNQYQGVLDKTQLYDILVDIIPPKKTFIKYISTKKSESEYIPFICEYYQCSPKKQKNMLK